MSLDVGPRGEQHLQRFGALVGSIGQRRPLIGLAVPGRFRSAVGGRSCIQQNPQQVRLDDGVVQGRVSRRVVQVRICSAFDQPLSHGGIAREHRDVKRRGSKAIPCVHLEPAIDEQVGEGDFSDPRRRHVEQRALASRSEVRFVRDVLPNLDDMTLT